MEKQVGLVRAERRPASILAGGEGHTAVISEPENRVGAESL